MPKKPRNTEQKRQEIRSLLAAFSAAKGVPIDTISAHALKNPNGSLLRCRHTGLPTERQGKVAYPTERAAQSAARQHKGNAYPYPCPDRNHWHLSRRPPW